MAFQQSTLYRLENPGMRDTPVWYAYRTADTMAQVVAADYFAQNPRYTLEPNDYVWASCSDGLVLLDIQGDGQTGVAVDLASGATLPPAIQQVVEVSTNTVIALDAATYFVDATAGDVTMTLPALGAGKAFDIKKVNTTGGDVIVVGPIDGDSQVVLTGSGQPAVSVVAGATMWGIV